MPSQSNAAGQQILLACFPHRKQAQINGKVLRSGYQVRDYAFYAAISVRRNRQPSRTDESNSSLHTYTPFKINLATNCKQYSKKNGKRQERARVFHRTALSYNSGIKKRPTGTYLSASTRRGRGTHLIGRQRHLPRRKHLLLHKNRAAI